MYWDQLNSAALGAMHKNIPVILPVAATEQHGAHLPLATDRMIGEHFCKRLNQEIEDQVIILPTISVGCSEHHTDFAGTLSIRHQTMLQQLHDIAECVVNNQFKNLIILNSHGGNQAIGQTFLEIFGFRNQQINLVFSTWWRLVSKELEKLNESGPGGVGHAGEFETSLMLLIAPHLVATQAMEKGRNAPTFIWATGDMLRGPQAPMYRSMLKMTPNGVFGDPTFASQEKGEKITQLVVQALKNLTLDLLKASQNSHH